MAISQSIASFQSTLSNITSLFGRLQPLIIKRVWYSWLAVGTTSFKEGELKDDTDEGSLLSLGSSSPTPSRPSSDETTLQLVLPKRVSKVSQPNGTLKTAQCQTRAVLYTRKQVVAGRMHDCLLDVELAKKHYVESQRAYFQANDELEEVERLIRNLGEEEAIIQPSLE